MTNTTTNLTNINLLTKAQYDAIQSPATDELWAVQCSVVVETYDDGNGNWYRLYSDGWVDQGGVANVGSGQATWNKTINLLLPFSDTNYNVFTTPQSSNPNQTGYLKQSNSQITVYATRDGGSSASQYMSWYACGYAASSN